MAGMDMGTSGFKRDPNVVPMIDILLVLLIIFMMQIPLQRKVMDVQVPEEQKVEKQVAKSDLDAQFHEIYDNRPAKLLFVRVGGTRKYQELIEAMDIARGAGVQVVGLTPPQEAQQD